MLRRLFILVSLALLSGCASFNTIENYEQRSIVYGWVSLEDVDGNHVSSIMMKQYKPRTDKPYYHMGFEELHGGYLFYHYGLTNGAYKADSIQAQSCIAVICGNTIYQYAFGSQGSDAAIVIKQVGVYSLGGFELLEEDTGFFEQGKFRVQATNIKPSKAEILDVLMRNSPDGHPIVTQRLQAHFR
jgi:hypothetical protein